MKTVLEQKAMSVEDAAAELNRLGGPAILLGDGTAVYMEKLEELLKVPFSAAPPHLSRQRAGALAALGARYFREGRVCTAAEHKPDYLRLSQAERERLERQKAESQTEKRKDGSNGTDS